jgi:hypothetical protein
MKSEQAVLPSPCLEEEEEEEEEAEATYVKVNIKGPSKMSALVHLINLIISKRQAQLNNVEDFDL